MHAVHRQQYFEDWQRPFPDRYTDESHQRPSQATVFSATLRRCRTFYLLGQ
ncbi:hypothetical protein [Enterobacter cancerogenus]|uniref:hypothetical protein n=1 Tax=Enterobacter cancerogenus TaxID=69218 RepID=UPI001D0DDB07|nr:hypothetical protein [Enterobacter cancerogenus]